MDGGTAGAGIALVAGAAMIVKDRLKHFSPGDALGSSDRQRGKRQALTACLESIRNLVDDVVTVDTGSDDSTVEIARQFGCKIFPFSLATGFLRRASFSAWNRFRADWVLYINAPKRTCSPAAATERDALDDPACIAGKVLLHPPCRALLPFGFYASSAIIP